MKKCRKCNTSKPLDDFCVDKSTKDGLRNTCRKCAKEYYYNNQSNQLEKNRQKRILDKMAAVDTYSNGMNACNCCGESILGFLTIDHIDGNGGEHRKEINVPAGYKFYAWLRQNDYPKGFQVLCWNCNSGRQYNNGVCPHFT